MILTEKKQKGFEELTKEIVDAVIKDVEKKFKCLGGHPEDKKSPDPLARLASEQSSVFIYGTPVKEVVDFVFHASFWHLRDKFK